MGFFNKIKNKLTAGNDKKIDEKSGKSNEQTTQSNVSTEINYNFRYLQDLIDNSEDKVILEHDIVLGEGEESEFPQGITVSCNIEGNGHYINARLKTQIFNIGISLNEQWIVSNLILMNGFTADNGVDEGGALTNTAPMIFINCQFHNNISERTGGAIVNKSEMILINCKFMLNSAKIGGTIYNEGVINILRSMFSFNTADEVGEVFFNLKGRMIIDSCIFVKNRSRNDMIANYQGDMKIYNTQFTRNDSWGKSILLLNNSFLTIEGSFFKNNTVVCLIANDEKFVSVSHVKFSENVVESLIYNNGNSFDIDNSIFKNNIPANDVYVNMENYSNLTLNNVEMDCDKKTILNKGNILINDDSSEIGNAIDNQGIMNYLYSEDKNDFEHLDKLIHENDSSTLVLDEDIYLMPQERYFYEGGIELNIDGLVIDGNGHTIDGGGKSRIFFVTGKNITLKNIIFKNGRCFENYEQSRNCSGGAIRVYPNADLEIINCKFIDNISEQHGGAIQNQGNLALLDSELNNNSIQPLDAFEDSKPARGGALYNEGKLTVTNTIFDSNTIEEIENDFFCEGGAIFNSEIGDATLIDSTLIKNNGVSFGGAIANKGKMAIIRTTIEKNKAISGPAIHGFRGNLTIEDGIIKNNVLTRDNENEIESYNDDGKTHIEIIKSEFE